MSACKTLNCDPLILLKCCISHFKYSGCWLQSVDPPEPARPPAPRAEWEAGGRSGHVRAGGETVWLPIKKHSGVGWDEKVICNLSRTHHPHTSDLGHDATNRNSYYWLSENTHDLPDWSVFKTNHDKSPTKWYSWILMSGTVGKLRGVDLRESSLWNTVSRKKGTAVHVSVQLTLLFRRSLSLSVSVSALAMTGTMLTLLWMAFMNSTSSGFRLGKKRKRRREEETAQKTPSERSIGLRSFTCM